MIRLAPVDAVVESGVAEGVAPGMSAVVMIDARDGQTGTLLTPARAGDRK